MTIMAAVAIDFPVEGAAVAPKIGGNLGGTAPLLSQGQDRISFFMGGLVIAQGVSLFLAVKRKRYYPRSPSYGLWVSWLVYKFAAFNNSLKRTLAIAHAPWRGDKRIAAHATYRACEKKDNEIMNQKVVIRGEIDADVSAITEVTVAAFKTLEISHHTEQFIVEALRTAKALTVSFVAELDGRVIGHIAFSPVSISDGTRDWYGLGPISVLPEYQRQGIGKALILEGLSRLNTLNAKGCCLVGHPDYYRKFGFKNMPGLVLEGVPSKVFFALSFDSHTPQGTVTFHEGFKAGNPPIAPADG